LEQAYVNGNIVFRERNVAERRAHVRLVQMRRAGMRQDLVDAAPCHHVSAEEKRHFT
jgi:hypothetical protein